ncbi:MAG TPA: hypothetical protein VF442_11710 [Sphingobium sp.]
MGRIQSWCATALIASSLGLSNHAFAQSQAGVVLDDSISPFGAVSVTNEEAAAVQMPQIDGPVTATDEGSFDKYYYFRRANTDLAAAFADISECDGYARGLSSGINYQTPYAYAGTMAGAVGGALGNAFVALVVGSAEKRQARRINMRACMGFKGYQRHGLPKPLWEKFNFEEGLDSVSDQERRRLLLQQALVASKALAAGKVLEP